MKPKRDYSTNFRGRKKKFLSITADRSGERSFSAREMAFLSVDLLARGLPRPGQQMS